MLVIDIQGFLAPHFVPKEMAITDGFRTSHYLFKPPLPWRHLSTNLQNSIKCVTSTRHGLLWYQGFVNLQEIDAILNNATQKENIIYCKGKKKAEYLRAHTQAQVVDLNEGNEEIDPFLDWSPPCFAHNLNTCRCALNNVSHLYTHLIKKYQTYFVLFFFYLIFSFLLTLLTLLLLLTGSNIKNYIGIFRIHSINCINKKYS